MLLTWDEGKLMCVSHLAFTPTFKLSSSPRAMLSDFGTSREMIGNSPVRSGNTGTYVCGNQSNQLAELVSRLEYSSPESVPSPNGVLHDVNSKSDMWSLGMILHKLLFFKLPYRCVFCSLLSR